MKFDYVVVGGGTAGCAVAYILGKANKNVLLIEKNIHLGGTMTSALVTPMMKTSDNSINNEFLDDFLNEMRKYDAAITYIDGNIGWFNPEIAKIVLDELMCKANVQVLYSASLRNVNISNRYINSIDIDINMLSVHIETKYVIDATGNCEVGKLSNCNFLENNSNFQPLTLRFIVENVNLKEFSDWITNLDKDRDVTTSCKINDEIHLSTAYTWDNNRNWALSTLFDDAVNKNILKDSDRNYFQLFTVPKMPNAVAFNCPRMILDSNISPFEPFMYSKSLQNARFTIMRLLKFMNIYLKGFENAYISNIADMVGIRENNRIAGKYVYTIADLKSGKKFDNPVLISNYPIDVHSTDKSSSAMEKINIEYQLPVESLISKDIDNLYVAGRCISADFYAQSALRIIPSCFSMGTGLAKYLLK
ncbi:FAD-dependent oxidoreductase [bacterium]|nr:FAD-dependent oxidoreductase [bacterium]